MTYAVRAPVALAGVGLHGGRTMTLRILPAAQGSGIVFRRTDIQGAAAVLPARYDRVVDTRLCTRLANEAGTSVGTIEHLMAALAALGIDDAEIRLDGPEVPIMDGSAQPFVDAILRVGLVARPGPRRAIRVRRSVEVRDGARRAALHPAPRFGASFEIAFDDSAIGRQTLSAGLAGGAILRDLSDCRTFCRLAEIEALRRAGLGLGGSLENAVVVDGARVLNPGGLRRPDEFVRHKMLDAVGDLALAGAPILAQYEGVRAGHEMTNRLLHALFADRAAWDWVDAAPGQLPEAPAVPGPARPAVAARLAV